MTLATKSWNFYGAFDISQQAFEDIKQRLATKELLWKHLMIDKEGREIIVFGTTALRAEINE